MSYQILSNRAIISVSGPDSTSFLQSLITQDIRKEIIYTMMLNPQGRYLFDFFISKVGEEYFIDLSDDFIEDLLNKLKLYKLRSKVKINSLKSEYTILYSKYEALNNECVSYYQDPRYLKLGWRYIIPTSSINKLETTDNNLYYIDKYQYAVPDGHIDMIPNKSLPPEYGSDLLNAISYTKGCYVGQEVLARTKYQGIVRKQIFQVISEDSTLEEIPQGHHILAGDNQIGIWCSGYQKLGIALIRKDDYKNNHDQDIRVNDILVTLQEAPWYISPEMQEPK